MFLCLFLQAFRNESGDFLIKTFLSMIKIFWLKVLESFILNLYCKPKDDSIKWSQSNILGSPS